MIDAQYYKSAAISLIVLNTVSFLALLFIVVIYAIRWKKIASFPMRLSFYLCISCLVQNLYVLVYNPILIHEQGSTNSPFCIFESFIKTAFDLSSIIWTTLIIYSSYASVVLKISLQSKQFVYLLVGYAFPLGVSIIPVFLDYYGPNVYYCWFSADSPAVQFYLKIGYFFAPLWLLFIVNVSCAAKTYQTLRKLGLGSRELSIFKRLLLFPFILLVTGIFATIDIIYIFANDSSSFLPWLDILSLTLLSCYGLSTAIAYGFNPLIRDHIKTLFGFAVPMDRSSISTSSSRRTDRLSQLIAFGST